MNAPRFDHSRDTTEVKEGAMTYLMQDGVRYTFAIFNRDSKKWEPEPRFIPEGLITRDDMRNKLDAVIFRSVELERIVREVRGVICNNLDQFIDRENDMWAVERSKYETEISKLSAALKEMEDSYYEESVKREKAEEEARTYAAQVKVYEDTIEKHRARKSKQQ